MIVEIPQNSANKYEYDGNLGVFRLDRALYSPLHYPGDYGFIPGTLADDKDPLDVLVLVQQPSYPGVMIEVRPVGVLNMVDNDEQDQKILAVPTLVRKRPSPIRKIIGTLANTERVLAGLDLHIGGTDPFSNGKEGKHV